MTRGKQQNLAAQFKRLNINKQVHNTAAVNCVLRPLEGNIHTRDSYGVKLYLIATRYIEKETDKLYITVKNTKDIVKHFLRLENKCGWGRLTFIL